MAKIVTSAVVVTACLVALVLGRGQFAGAVIVLAALVTLDLTGLLARARSRPVLPAAAFGALGAPVVVAAARPEVGWARLPVTVVASVLLAFTLVLIFGRRDGAVRGLAATMFVSLLVGMGAAGVLLLRDLDHGFRLVLGLVVLVVAAEVAAPLLRLGAGMAARRRNPFGALAEPDDPVEGRDVRVVPALVLVALVAVVIAIALRPPFTPAIVAIMAVIVLTASVGAQHLMFSMAQEAGVDPQPETIAPGSGLFAGVTGAVAIGAPVAYVVTRGLML